MKDLPAGGCTILAITSFVYHLCITVTTVVNYLVSYDSGFSSILSLAVAAVISALESSEEGFVPLLLAPLLFLLGLIGFLYRYTKRGGGGGTKTVTDTSTV